MKPLQRLIRALTLMMTVWILSGSAVAQLPAGFVYPQDTLFMKSNGDGTSEPFYFSGTNNYYMMYKPMNMAEDILDGMVCLNQKVVRMWFFMDGTKIHDGYNLQPEPYTYNEAGYQHLDSIMVELAARDLKCIPVFVNYWSDFGGMAQYAQWTGGSQADFFSDPQMKDIYREYVRSWVTRTNSVSGVKYADDPTIFSWQLTNEGRSTSATVGDYVAWADEMSTFIKSLDPNHMVSMGDEALMNYSYDEVNQINAQRASEGKELITNDWQYAGGQGDWIGLLQLPNLDFGTIHNYATDNWSKDLPWGETWTRYHIEIAHGMNKPCIMEEYDKAYSGNWDLTKDQERAEVMQAYTDIIYEKDMAGDCSWMLVGVNYWDAPENGKTTDVEGPCETTLDVEDIWLYRDKWPGDGHQYSAYDPYTAPVLKAHGQRMLDKNIQDVPQSFALTYPTDGAVDVSVIPALEWTNAQFATNYTLTVSANSDMSDPVYVVNDITSAGYTIPVESKLAYSTQYYWSVTAKNYIGEREATTHFSFNTQSPPPPVGNFAAVAPSGQDVGVDETQFSWSQAANADYYALIVSENSDLSAPVIHEGQLAGNTFTSPVALENATTYYWTVTAHNTLYSQSISDGTMAFSTRLQDPTIDNFESYASSTAMSGAWVRNTGGGNVTVTIGSSASEGMQSMRLDYDFTSYAGVTRSFANDWTGYDGVSFWLQGDNSGRELLLQFQEASGEYWEQTITIGATEVIYMPFSDFANPGWGGSVNGIVDLEAISAVSFYFGGQAGSGTIYIDDLKAAISGNSNRIPTANAGADQTVTDADEDGLENVSLVGNGSFDADGSITAYTWSDGASTLGTTANLEVSLPVGTHTLTLTVTDNDGNTDTDEVLITVVAPANTPPVAVAGDDIIVSDDDGDGVESVTLDASASSDADGSIAEYTWIDAGVVIGESAVIAAQLPVGVHTIQLQVRDNEGATAVDEIQISVSGPAQTCSSNDHCPAGYECAGWPDYVCVPISGGDPDPDQNANKIGILWTSWDVSHFTQYQAYINDMDSWGIDYVSINPTYFLNTYAEGILTEWEGAEKTPGISLQKSVIKELLSRDYYINYRPHIDPIKYAMPLGATRDNWNTIPGGQDWRGKFDQLNPIDPTIGYREQVVLPGLQMLAEAIRESGIPSTPIRYDLGAELMDAMLNYPAEWISLRDEVRHLLETTYSDVADHITLSHNFCHHIEYLLTIPDHDDYMQRIEPDQQVNQEGRFLDRPGVTDATRSLIGQYIAGLDELTISQYMPLDIFQAGASSTPGEVAQALQYHEDNFINEVLINTLGIAPEDIPVLHIGEYGMGWRGLAAPNVWDVDAWNNAGAGHLILSESQQKADAAIAIDGIIQYVSDDSDTRFNSFLLWFGGAPYDVIGINDYSLWYNEPAADALSAYWETHSGAPSPLVPPFGGSTGVPVANAGSDLVLTDADNSGFESVTLNGSMSYDDGSIVAYSWSIAGEEVATGQTAAIDLAVGSHAVVLTVTDNEGLSDTDNLLVTIENGSDNQANGFYVSGTQLMDANGIPFVIRGVSHAHTWYTDQTQSALANIANTGTNTVRIVLSNGERWTRNNGSEVAGIIQQCKNLSMVPILEVHDATGWNEQTGGAHPDTALDYWLSADIRAAIDGEEEFVIINIANEPFGNTTTGEWASWHMGAISALRNAGISHSLMVDAPNWGQDWSNTMLANAQNIFNSDPDQNVIFSVHMYEVYSSPNAVSNYLQSFANLGLPLVVGEFADTHGSSGDVAEDAIMQYCEQLGFGYIGWSWSGNGPGLESLDIVSDFSTNLTTWGEKLIHGTHGIAATSSPATVFGGGNNQAPLANAGIDQTVVDSNNDGSEAIALDGSASSDDGNIVSYSWVMSGTEVASGQSATIVLAVGSHVITLVVTDAEGLSDSDDVMVEIVPGVVEEEVILEAENALLNSVNVISDASASGGAYVNMEGTGDITWSFEASTAGTQTIKIGYLLPYGNKTQYLNVNSVYVGAIEFDGQTNVWNEKSIDIAVNAGVNTVTLSKSWGYMYFDYLGTVTTGDAPDNTPPTANAGNDLVVIDNDHSGEEVVFLDGTFSQDDDGNIVDYIWSEQGVILGNGSTFEVSFTVGIHVVELNVTDNHGATHSDQVTITVEEGSALETVYEAENASLIGTFVQSDASASAGQYVEMQGNNGKVTWTFEVPQSGNYPLVIGYQTPYGAKTQWLNVNTVYIGEITFDGNGNWQEQEVNVHLNAGTNTLTLTANWGYMNFDYLKVPGNVSNRQGKSLGMDQTQLDKLIRVFPNPASGMVNIEADEFISATVISLAGKIILHAVDQRINLHDLDTGLYLIEVNTTHGSLTKRLFVK